MKTPSDRRSPKQQKMDFLIKMEKKINDIEMGIMENGSAYLTKQGVADICGVDPKRIYDISNEWVESYNDEVFGSDRKSFIRHYLFSYGFNHPKLYLEVLENKNGTLSHLAYPSIVCMAILEYYAFEAKNKSQTALSYFRKFSANGLINYIYNSFKYVKEDPYSYYHSRISLLQANAPTNYFILFNETHTIVYDLIIAGLTVNHTIIPDISIGIHWGNLWNDENFEAEYGPRIKFKHNYPDEFPQSASNPQDAWAYPDEALIHFRRWFKTDYLLTKFPEYILKKARINATRVF